MKLVTSREKVRKKTKNEEIEGQDEKSGLFRPNFPMSEGKGLVVYGGEKGQEKRNCRPERPLKARRHLWVGFLGGG